MCATVSPSRPAVFDVAQVISLLMLLLARKKRRWWMRSRSRTTARRSRSRRIAKTTTPSWRSCRHIYFKVWFPLALEILFLCISLTGRLFPVRVVGVACLFAAKLDHLQVFTLCRLYADIRAHPGQQIPPAPLEWTLS